MRKLFVALAFVVTAFAATAARPERADAAQCYVATGKAANVLCWLDMSSANVSSGASTPMSWTLPDGSVLSATLTNSAPGAPVGSAPVYNGAALGNTAYTGIGGKPVFYSGGTFSNELSSIVTKDTQNNALATTTIAGADGESLDTGDGAGGYVSWSTNGPIWSVLEIMNSTTSGTSSPICTLANPNTANPVCTPSASGNNAAYILRSTVTSSTTVTMGASSSSLQGYAFAVNLAQLTVVKNVTSRVATNDQFTVAISRSGTSLASAATTGTGTGVRATASLDVVPTDTYTLSETSSGTSLSQYSTTYACANAYSSSTTSFPAGGTGTSVTITPAANDQISCTFTNVALTSTNTAANTTANVEASTSVVDNFTFKNTSAVAANFGGTAPTLTASAGGTIAASGYVYGGTTYSTYASLLSAIDASPTAANGSVTVGVVYTTPATTDTTVTIVTNSDVTINGSTSSVQTAQEVDTVSVPTIKITKSATAQSYPNGPITYTIVVSNTATLGAGGATFSDPVPAGVTIVNATCGSATGNATCPTITKSGNTESATIGNFPQNSSLTFTITATAGSAAAYTNTASLSFTPLLAATINVTASATTSVTQASTFQKTVQNLTSGTAAGTSNTALPGDQLQYTLSFQNTTGVTLHGISLTDPLPSTITYSAASCGTLPNGVTCSVSAPTVGSTGTVVFSYSGFLSNGSSLSATINAYVK